MGFFTALGRIVKGEPVFQPGDGQPGVPSSSPVQPLSAQPQPQPPLEPKVHPHIVIEDCECDTDDSYMSCEVEVQNESEIQLDIDIVRMLGSSRDMGTFLRPGEARKFKVYHGPVPKSTADNRCTIAFRTHPGGDHFTADFLLEFKKLPDTDGYEIARFRSLSIRDT